MAQLPEPHANQSISHSINQSRNQSSNHSINIQVEDDEDFIEDRARVVEGLVKRGVEDIEVQVLTTAHVEPLFGLVSAIICLHIINYI